MIELQIHTRNRIGKLNCKHEMKRTFPTFLYGMFAFDSFLLERKMDVIELMIVCRPGESG